VACTQARSEAIGDLAAGRLDARASEELLDHLERCAACSAEFDEVADLVAGASRLDARARRILAERRHAWIALAAAVLILVTALALFGPAVLAPGNGERSVAELASLDPVPVVESTLRTGELPDAAARRFEEAMESYRDGDFERAAQDLAAVAVEAPDDPLTHLYLGIARLQLDEHRDAVAALEVAAGAEPLLLRERALWYLANAWLARSDVDRAHSTLEDLAAIEGDYELNARDLLDAIRRRVP